MNSEQVGISRVVPRAVRTTPVGGGRRANRRGACAVLAVAAMFAVCLPGYPVRPGRAPYTSAGLIGSATLPGARAPIGRELAARSGYLPDTSVLAMPGDRARLIPPGGTEPVTLPADDPRVRAAISADRAWLRSGTIPGDTPYARSAATRALLDLRLLTSPNGACVASWPAKWNYVWPRDAAFAVVAFSATGHRVEASRILRFLAGVQAPTGLWAARYRPDGSPVTDGRTLQLDAIGWVLWAAWYYQVTGSDQDRTTLRAVWPAIQRAANRAMTLIGPDGMPPPSSDYWERAPGSERDPQLPTLGVVAPLRAGLRAAVDLARRTGHTLDARSWRQAARRLDRAIRTRFEPHGYTRQPSTGSPADSAVTFLAPPFAPPDPAVRRAVRSTGATLRMARGGVLPGAAWAGSQTEAWTPETAMFGLAAQASGDPSEAATWLAWLLAHRTPLGSFPERVDERGEPASVAPLGWTSSVVLLTLVAQDHKLPIPPVR